MIIIKYVTCSIMLVVVIALAYADDPSPMGILEKRCYTCHNINIVLKAKKNEDEWKKTINRMIRYGANLSKEERKILIKFLNKS